MTLFTCAVHPHFHPLIDIVLRSAPWPGLSCPVQMKGGGGEEGQDIFSSFSGKVSEQRSEGRGEEARRGEGLTKGISAKLIDEKECQGHSVWSAVCARLAVWAGQGNK